MQIQESANQIAKAARLPDAEHALKARPAPREKREAPEWTPVTRAVPHTEVRPRHYGAGF